MSAARELKAPARTPLREVEGRKSSNRARRAAAALRQRAKLRDRQPKHVKHCYATGSRDWWIYTWKKEGAAHARRIPYMCQSWRCPECKRHDAAVNFARFTEAAAPLKSNGWVFLTLTLKRDCVKSWQSVDTAYKDLSVRTRNFFSRLRRWMKRNEWKAFENQWIGVVEAHRSGWPHMHFMIWSPDLASHCRHHPTEGHFLSEELAVHAENCGWGARSTLEPGRSAQAMASYLVKLSGEADRLQGEISKMTQLPTVAPIKFRRLRAGKGFLPPRKKNDEYTGTLLRRRPDRFGTSVSPIHSKEECPLTEFFCVHEEERTMKNFASGEPEKPVDSIDVPDSVLASYNAKRKRDIDAAAAGNSSADCSVNSLSPVKNGSQALQDGDKLYEAAKERRLRWEKEQQLAQLRFTPISARSAAPMYQTANTSPTGSPSW